MEEKAELGVWLTASEENVRKMRTMGVSENGEAGSASATATKLAA
jgi:hypothetical protein